MPSLKPSLEVWKVCQSLFLLVEKLNLLKKFFSPAKKGACFGTLLKETFTEQDQQFRM